jgi:gluconolactonase
VFDSAGSLYFTDSGPEGDTGLHNPLGSVFVMQQRMLRPIALRCLACPTGIALSPNESALFVAEAAQNRILRYTQKPLGVWHGTVFFQFSGRLGPSALVVDRVREFLYCARPEYRQEGAGEAGGRSLVAVLSLEGKLLKEFEVPGVGPEISSMVLSPDGKDLIVAEASSSSIVSVTL